MLWVGAILLTTATAAATPASPMLASTYDEAACADAEPGAVETPAPAIADGSVDCSEMPVAPAPLPVVLDCNDERASMFVAEMIGSCDMPKTLNAAPAILKAANASQRLCSGLNCNFDSSPLRAAARPLDDTQTLGAHAPVFIISLVSSPLPPLVEQALVSTPPARIDRPPRAAA